MAQGFSVPNIFTVESNAGYLCIGCLGCGHRNAVAASVLRGRDRHRHEMYDLAGLPYRCTKCGGREVEWLVPISQADAVTYVAGGVIGANVRSSPQAGRHRD